MLSCWQQWDAAGVPGSALSQWLVGIDVDSGPDGRNSPTFLKQNFDVQEAADLYQAVHLHTLEDLVENGPYPKVISQLALRIITYEYPLEAILAIYYLSATGYLPAKFPHDQWNEAVRWHGDTKLAAIIHNEAEWADANIILSKLGNVVVEAESQHGVVVWSSTQNCPSTIFADSYLLQLIVLSGEEIQRQRDLGVGISCTLSPGTFPSDLTKKDSRSTDLRWLPWRKMSMFRPSLEARRQYRSLHWAGVRLHMNSWCSITLDWIAPSIGMHSCLKSCRRFSSRVIAPSHRRMPYVLWTDSMTLIWNLLMGGRMGRYTGSPDTLVFDQRIDLRGFSAGSFAGLSTLHLLWKIPNVVTNGKLGAIACPPQLIVTPFTCCTMCLEAW